ncbi:MAG: hypothetical protein NC299_08655 [Lachnospiraceae bacterium]|nr:hypothetical protein [Ruminococcus sp.]MCM1275423.1 hypothetical protein [Lachnospiraceae bacterium]
MNILRKAAACFAAAAVMTSLAVTASAEYKVSGVNGNDGKYYLRIVGLPEELSNDPDGHPIGMVTVNFSEDDGFTSLYRLRFNVYNRSDETECLVITLSNEILETLNCNLMTFEGFDGELGFLVEFSADDEYLPQFAHYKNAVLQVGAGYFEYDSNNNITGSVFDTYSSDGKIAADNYTEKVVSTWQEIGAADTSEPVSEPTSSEPAPEEPAASEPVSEPAPSAPTNVDTGVTGVAAVFGAAALAAGVVIAARKKK